jgi:hypothetical protein
MTALFIGGAGRSGTTLVADLIGLHPSISPIYETDFLVQLAKLLGREGPALAKAEAAREFMERWTRPLPHRPHNKRSHERYHHGPHHILFERDFAMARTEELCGAILRGRDGPGLRSFVDALFSEHCRLDGKPRWANKTPAYVQMLPVLHQLWPGMRFLHCVRDGRDVAASVLTRPWGPDTPAAAARWWGMKASAGVRWGHEHPEQYRELRYEDLLQDPQRELDGVLTWLGERPDTRAILDRTASIGLDPSRAGGWQSSMGPTEIDAFEAVGRDLLTHFGYAPASRAAG